MSDSGIHMDLNKQRAVLTLQTLGHARIAVDGVAVPLPAKCVALLAILAISTKRASTRDSLITLLWPSVSPQRARHSFSQALTLIRQPSTKIRLQVDNDVGSIKLLNRVKWDVHEAERLIRVGRATEAFGRLDQGFLNTLVIPDANDFEDWRSEREAEIRKRVLQTVTDVLLEKAWRGEWLEVRRLIASTQQSYWIADILGMGINDNVMNRVTHALSVVTTDNSEGSANYVAGRWKYGSLVNLRIPLVGRENEINRLRAIAAEVGAHSQRLVVIEGAAGSGKSHLCSRFASAWSALIGRAFYVSCYETETDAGFASLARMVADAGVTSQIEQLAPSARQNMIDLASIAGGRGQISDVRDRTQIFDAFLQLCKGTAAVTPLMIYVDDIQWADESTVAALQYLIRRTTSTAILVVLSSRTEAWHTKLLVDHHFEAVVLRLSDLTLTDVAAALQRRRFSKPRIAHLAQTIMTSTHGQPYFVGEVMATLWPLEEKQWSPSVIRRSVAKSRKAFTTSWTADLTPEAAGILAATAVLGQPTRIQIVRAISGLSHAAFTHYAQEVFTKELLVEDASHLACRHDLIRETVYDNLSGATRKYLHWRCAEVLSRAKHNSETLVFHYRASGQRRSAYVHALRAATSSKEKHAYHEAAHFLQLALRCTRSERKKAVLRLRRASVLQSVGRLREANRLLERLETEHGLLARVRIESIVRRLEIARATGVQSATVILKEAITVASEAGNARMGTLSIRALALAVRSAFDSGNAKLLEELSQQLLTHAEEEKPSASTAVALQSSAIGLAMIVNPVGADHLFERALEIARRAGSEEVVSSILINRGIGKYLAGDLTSALDFAKDGTDLAIRAGLIKERRRGLNLVSVVYMTRGDLDRAAGVMDEVISLGSIDESIQEVSVTFANYAWLELQRGNVKKARDLANRAVADAGVLKADWRLVASVGILGLAALQNGELALARTCASRVRARLKRRPYNGDDATAIEQLLARCAEIEGKSVQAADRLKLVLEQYRSLNVPCRLTLELELAKLLSRTSPQEAHTWAFRAREGARAIGALPIHDQADSLIDRLASRSTTVVMPFGR